MNPDGYQVRGGGAIAEKPHKEYLSGPEHKPPHVQGVATLHQQGAAPVPRLLNRDDELPFSEQRYLNIMRMFEVLHNGVAALVEQRAAEIPGIINEYAYNASATVLTSQFQSLAGVAYQPYSTLQPQTNDLEVIEAVVACVPSSQTGLVQLGNITIPVGQGTTVLAPVQFRLLVTDLRSINVTSAGPVALILTGKSYPTRGRMPL